MSSLSLSNYARLLCFSLYDSALFSASSFHRPLHLLAQWRNSSNPMSPVTTMLRLPPRPATDRVQWKTRRRRRSCYQTRSTSLTTRHTRLALVIVFHSEFLSFLLLLHALLVLLSKCHMGQGNTLPSFTSMTAALFSFSDPWYQAGFVLATGMNSAYVLGYSGSVMVPLGWIGGMCGLILAAAISLYANALVAQLHQVGGKRHIRYRDLAGHIYG